MGLPHHCDVSIRPAKMKRLASPSSQEDVEKTQLSFTSVGTETGTSILERAQQFLRKSNLHLPSDPAILLCVFMVNSVYPRKKKVMSTTCTSTYAQNSNPDLVLDVAHPTWMSNRHLKLHTFKAECPETSLVVQWLRIRLPRQGTRVRALVREDPTRFRATKPVHHNY